MNIKKIFLRIGFVAAMAAIGYAFPAILGAAKFDIKGRVESVRKDATVTILFKSLPGEKTYILMDNGTVIGTAEVLSTVPAKHGKYAYRSVAEYSLSNKKFRRTLRAGIDVVLERPGKKTDVEYADATLGKEPEYRPGLVSAKDGRQMVLVKEGKFIFGTNNGDRDESPEQAVYLDNFYIDTYEVSSEEFFAFVKATNAGMPASWKGGRFPDSAGKLPVLVTYYEAEAYARWAGKRLPTEEEWEKAARGSGRFSEGGAAVDISYPWGNTFNPEFANCADFWANEKTGAHIKMRFNVKSPGLLPVDSFNPEGISPCGALNMAGNAREWTSSWYLPHTGNTSRKGPEYKRYGRQYKVVRGGSWYSERYRLRTTSRELGGVPNLYSDNLAGFRCVRDPDNTDLEAAAGRKPGFFAGIGSEALPYLIFPGSRVYCNNESSDRYR